MNALKNFLKRLRTKSRRWAKWLWLLVPVVAIALLTHQSSRETDARKTPATLQFERSPSDWLKNPRDASELFKAIDGGQVVAVAQAKDQPGLVLFTLKTGAKASTTIPGCTLFSCSGTPLDKLAERSASQGFALVSADIDRLTLSGHILSFLDHVWGLLFPVAIIVVAYFFLTGMRPGMGGKAVALSERPDTKFDDVIGNAEAKAALNRVKAFLHDPSAYAKVGASAPRGVLLVGPPGTGKTLLARALAGECNANFIAVDGSYFTAMYYGAGVAKVEALFKLARKNAPTVLFIDEIDGIGARTHGSERSGGESELNRIINRVLVEMDGFAPMDNVVVVGATNHENNIDEAMRRPGRFDMLVRLVKPTLPERAKLFDLYLAKVVADGSADSSSLARMTPGLTPAEIANIVNKAASSAAEAGADMVSSDHLLRAIETQLLGGEISPVKELLTEDTRVRLAYHEAGHALVGHWTGAGLVERVTIEPRGQALGTTYVTRDTEDPLYQQDELVSRLAMMLGGREAELLVLKSVSSGASDDLKRASGLAIEMVGSLGFSGSFGLLSVEGIPDKLLGPDIQAAVLREARMLLEEAQATCRELLTAQRGRLDAIAQALLACEVLQGAELKEMLGVVGESSPADRHVMPVAAARMLLELTAARHSESATTTPV